MQYLLKNKMLLVVLSIKAQCSEPIEDFQSEFRVCGLSFSF